MVAEWVKQLDIRRWQGGSNNRTLDGGGVGQTIGYKTVAEWVKQSDTRRWRSESNN